MDYFNNLPVDITADILTRLPTESVLESKLVCTSWRNLVSHHPSFIKKHLDHLNNHDSGKLGFVGETLEFGDTIKKILYYFEYNKNDESNEKIRSIVVAPLFDRSSFVGSCNGLICLSRFSRPNLEICICNIITKEYVMLPQVKGDCDCYRWTSGFGYVSNTNEYKVVGICVFDANAEVYIYTLGSVNGWRSLGKFDFEFRRYEDPWKEGIFANGALYWTELKLEVIVSLDLAEEKFCGHLELPPASREYNWTYESLGVLDGFLCLVVYVIVEKTQCHDIWLLKKKNDNHDMEEREEHQSWVWSREYRNDEIKRRFAAVTKSGGVLTYYFHDLYFYDPKASTSKKIMEFKEGLLAVFPHKNTLVSLKELGEEDVKIMESVETEEIESLSTSFRRM